MKGLIFCGGKEEEWMKGNSEGRLEGGRENCDQAGKN